MPNNSLGIYKVITDYDTNQDYNAAYFIYRGSKYIFSLATNNKDDDGLDDTYLFTGKFVPSKVEDTDDLYIMSFIELQVSRYNYDKDKTRMNGILGKKVNNDIVIFKYENNKILVWYNLFPKEVESDKSQDFKRLVSGYYHQTLVKDPDMVFVKTSEPNNVEITAIDKYISQKMQKIVEAENPQ